MNWHTQFQKQARWTADLRAYLFDKAGLGTASRVLEVGCGTGAILSETRSPAPPHGLDLNLARLREARINAPGAVLLCADGLSLPYPAHSFDIVFCHYLLLWVNDPLGALGEMRRVSRPGGVILALAEPDYSQRVDEPPELIPLGRLQNEALTAQGADPFIGGRLAELFDKAGITLLETGPLATGPGRSGEDEWAVIESDLGHIPVEAGVIQKFKEQHRLAVLEGKRVLRVPTYFAWGK
jgi:ubiquinone/menaquinone biosynthesis C-methylase UbiE